MNREKSEKLFIEAEKVIPGGVNSPVRAFKSVNMAPVFIDRGKGSKIYDVDGNEYTDYICSWGPLILGHASPVYFDGIQEALEKGTSFGAPTAIEVDMAKLMTQAYPSMEMVRMVSSGTEATMSALRVARGFTGRDKIIKFEGCYHGHADGLLVKSGSGTLTFGVPTSSGVTPGTARDTLVATYNDIESVKALFRENPGEIAAIIVEPVAGNMGVVPPDMDFMKGLREITESEGTVLIFDEVITGFRLAYGGAQEVFGIKPDMTTLGKIIGGGMPVGAYGGRRDIMETVAPLGGVYQAGTLSGNPIAMKMGMNTLTYLRDHPEIYVELEEKAKLLEAGFKANIKKTGVKAQMVRVKGMTCLFFTDQPINGYKAVMTSDTNAYTRYFKSMLDAGNLLPPAQFEGIFLSTAHTIEDIQKTIEDNYQALKNLK
ncbi:glutamate-1-semialdehyde 2,1-aminomutase [Acetobacterium sp.]|uniref:glutamate-1-semialdehyde 2,1-aminomutase n=1 Tax=Acetobacterium sp. TaxID=1872094 RepID=UPI002F42604E